MLWELHTWGDLSRSLQCLQNFLCSDLPLVTQGFYLLYLDLLLSFFGFWADLLLLSCTSRVSNLSKQSQSSSTLITCTFFPASWNYFCQCCGITRKNESAISNDSRGLTLCGVSFATLTNSFKCRKFSFAVRFLLFSIDRACSSSAFYQHKLGKKTWETTPKLL